MSVKISFETKPVNQMNPQELTNHILAQQGYGPLPPKYTIIDGNTVMSLPLDKDPRSVLTDPYSYLVPADPRDTPEQQKIRLRVVHQGQPQAPQPMAYVPMQQPQPMMMQQQQPVAFDQFGNPVPVNGMMPMQPQMQPMMSQMVVNPYNGQPMMVQQPIQQPMGPYGFMASAFGANMQMQQQMQPMMGPPIVQYQPPPDDSVYSTVPGTITPRIENGNIIYQSTGYNNNNTTETPPVYQGAVSYKVPEGGLPGNFVSVGAVAAARRAAREQAQATVTVPSQDPTGVPHPVQVQQPQQPVAQNINPMMQPSQQFGMYPQPQMPFNPIGMVPQPMMYGQQSIPFSVAGAVPYDQYMTGVTNGTLSRYTGMGQQPLPPGIHNYAEKAYHDYVLNQIEIIKARYRSGLASQGVEFTEDDLNKIVEPLMPQPIKAQPQSQRDLAYKREDEFLQRIAMTADAAFEYQCNTYMKHCMDYEEKMMKRHEGKTVAEQLQDLNYLWYEMDQQDNRRYGLNTAQFYNSNAYRNKVNNYMEPNRAIFAPYMSDDDTEIEMQLPEEVDSDYVRRRASFIARMCDKYEGRLDSDGLPKGYMENYMANSNNPNFVNNQAGQFIHMYDHVGDAEAAAVEAKKQALAAQHAQDLKNMQQNVKANTAGPVPVHLHRNKSRHQSLEDRIKNS